MKTQIEPCRTSSLNDIANGYQEMHNFSTDSNVQNILITIERQRKNKTSNRETIVCGLLLYNGVKYVKITLKVALNMYLLHASMKNSCIHGILHYIYTQCLYLGMLFQNVSNADWLLMRHL